MSIQAKYMEKLEYYKGLKDLCLQMGNLIEEKRLARSQVHDNIELTLELDDEIYNLETKQNELSKESSDEYILKVHDILSEYSKCNQNTEFESMNTGFFGFVQQKVNQNNKGQLYTKYMLVIEDEPSKEPPKTDSHICKDCNVPKVVSTVDSTYICKSCGSSEHFFDVSVNGLTYEQEINTESNFTFAYKRVNHFRELLAQLQAKESSDIPDDIIERVRSEFKKARIKSVKEITQDKVKVYLKKLGFNKYYEHARQITNILNGTPPPNISCELYEKLSNMFYDIQAPFDQVCPADRKNFFSYNYILYKFCELLEEYDTMKLFPLLKSREKLYKQDCMWKEICAILGWTFYKSV